MLSQDLCETSYNILTVCDVRSLAGRKMTRLFVAHGAILLRIVLVCVLQFLFLCL